MFGEVIVGLVSALLFILAFYIFHATKPLNVKTFIKVWNRKQENRRKLVKAGFHLANDYSLCCYCREWLHKVCKIVPVTSPMGEKFFGYSRPYGYTCTRCSVIFANYYCDGGILTDEWLKQPDPLVYKNEP